MTAITCAHPNCQTHLARGRMVCGRHWFALTEYLREQSKRVLKDNPSAVGALRIEMEHYFRTRMIGVHEIVACRGSTCGMDIVWLSGHGKKIAVNASTVTNEDKVFDHKKHTPHVPTCKNKDEFRR